MSQSKNTGQHYIECAICIQYSKFYCNTCHLRLCLECRDVHLREKENRKHEVVLYQDRIRELPIEKCQIHPTKTLEIFCVDCLAPVCSKCFATDHNGHQVLDLELVYNESLQQCQNELIKIRDTILPQCVEEVKSQRERVEEIKNDMAKLRLSMKQSADEMKTVVDTIVTENNAKLDVIETSILDEMTKQQKKSDDYISYLEKLIKDYDSDVSSGKLTDIIRFNKKNKNIILMKFPKIIELTVPTFTKGRIIKEEIEKIFGNINPCEEVKILKEESKKIQESIHQFNSKPNQQLCMELSSSAAKVQEVNIAGLNAIIHLSPAVPSKKIWASDDDKNLIQFDMQGNILQKISTGKQQLGYHAVTEDENLLYTDYEKKAIYRVNRDMTTTTLLTTEHWEPWSIWSSHINGDILVGMKKDEKWKIARYDRGGMKLQDIQKNDKGNDLFLSVSYITENINGDICTSDYDASKVVVVTASGEYRFSYAGNFLLFRPYGICTDVLGNILVCSSAFAVNPGLRVISSFLSDMSEFGIHLLDQDGKFLSFLPRQNLMSPYLCALCVDHQNSLMVGNARRPTVSVFKYLKSKSTL